MKPNFRIKINKICATLKSDKRAKLLVLEKNLDKEMILLDANLHITDNINLIQKKIEELQEDLHLIHREITDDIISKRISAYYRKTETVSKYFLSFGRRNPRRGLYSLYNSRGELMNENDQILVEAASFFEEIYSDRALFGGGFFSAICSVVCF